MYKHVYQRVDTLLCEPMARGRFSREREENGGKEREIFKMDGCTTVYERENERKRDRENE